MSLCAIMVIHFLLIGLVSNVNYLKLKQNKKNKKHNTQVESTKWGRRALRLSVSLGFFFSFFTVHFIFLHVNKPIALLAALAGECRWADAHNTVATAVASAVVETRVVALAAEKLVLASTASNAQDAAGAQHQLASAHVEADPLPMDTSLHHRRRYARVNAHNIVRARLARQSCRLKAGRKLRASEAQARK